MSLKTASFGYRVLSVSVLIALLAGALGNVPARVVVPGDRAFGAQPAAAAPRNAQVGLTGSDHAATRAQLPQPQQDLDGQTRALNGAQGSEVALAPAAAVAAAAQSPAAANPPAGLTTAEWSSLQSQMRAAQYQVTWQTLAGQAPAYRAPNRAQGFEVALAPEGFTAAGEDWQVSLRLASYGGRPVPALTQAQLQADRDTVTYVWSDQVREWYHNRPEGVEHGFTLLAPPAAGETQVELAMTLSTDLRPGLSAEGQVLSFYAPEPGGAEVLRYDSVRVTDAGGQALPARLALAGETLRLQVDAAGAAYPLTVDPLLHAQVSILHASDMQPGDQFGWSVSVSGDTLVVGSCKEDGGASNPAPMPGQPTCLRATRAGPTTGDN
jgi:hypothetical protein